MRAVRPPDVALICAICERTLLVGERATRFTHDGGDHYVDVCPLCSEVALQHGWVKEGSPTTPAAAPLRRRRRLSLAAIFDPKRAGAEEPVLSEPILRRLSKPEQAIVEAAELFNASSYRRTVGGIARSLGEPKVSIVPLSGVNTEVVVTVAWELSWYQYRVSFDAPQPVRLEERGLELDELEAGFLDWNTELSEDGRLVPSIARV
jgi:hypothetical protein